MKKAMFLAIAACLMIFAACGNGGDKSKDAAKNSEQEVVAIPENFVNYECENFTMSHPDGMKATWQDDIIINLSNEDGSLRIDASFSTFGTAISELKEAGENYVSMMQMMGSELVKEPVVKDNTMTCQLKDGKEINNYFIVTNDKHCVSGSVVYYEDRAGDFESYVAPIVASIKVN